MSNILLDIRGVCVLSYKYRGQMSYRLEFNRVIKQYVLVRINSMDERVDSGHGTDSVYTDICKYDSPCSIPCAENNYNRPSNPAPTPQNLTASGPDPRPRVGGDIKAIKSLRGKYVGILTPADDFAKGKGNNG